MYFSWISCSVYIELDFFFKQTHTYKVLQYYNVHHDKLMPKNKTYRKAMVLHWSILEHVLHFILGTYIDLIYCDFFLYIFLKNLRESS